MPRKVPHGTALVHCRNLVSLAGWQLVQGFTRFTDENGEEFYKLNVSDGNEVCSLLSVVTDYLEWNTEDLR